MLRKLICLAFAAIVWLAGSVSGGTYSAGSGTAEDPYLVATAADMNEIGANPIDWHKHFLLVADINLADYTGTKFNIIGSYYDKPFTGVFDGNGHIISNFTYECTGNNGIGLFGYVDSVYAEIKDLTLIDANISAGTGDTVGALVGLLIYGTVTDCRIEDCRVSGSYDIGGLVGDNLCGVISDCCAAGMVYGDEAVGGLVGENLWGLISSCSAAGTVDANEATGGLVGYNCDGVVSNCYAVNKVDGNDYTGGLVGDSYLGAISNCYAAGRVNGNDYTGGLVGYDCEGNYIGCFWDTDINPDVNGIGNTSDLNVMGQSTANMQTESIYSNAGWDFTAVWDICEGTSYPRLLWQIPPGNFLCPYGVDFLDYSFFADHWLDTNCADSNDCEGTDLDYSGRVDANDLQILCDHWLEGTGR